MGKALALGGLGSYVSLGESFYLFEQDFFICRRDNVSLSFSVCVGNEMMCTAI